MLYYLGQFLQQYWGPARLLTSYAVLITLALYLGFILAYKLIPKFYDVLPHDRGREFTLKDNAEAAKGKPTGTGVVFISIFVVVENSLYSFDKVTSGLLNLLKILENCT